MKKYLATIITAFFCTLLASSQKPATTKNPADYYDDGKAYEAKKDYSKALEAFKIAISANPSYLGALYEAGWCCNELEKYSDALSFLEKARTLDPSEPKVHFEIGYANQKLGKYDDAIKAYDQCIELKKDYKSAYHYRGNTFYEKGNYARALEDYSTYEIYENNITNDKFYFRKGYCLNDAGRYSDAIIALKNSVLLNRKYVSTFDELGFAFYKLKIADSAVENYNKSIAINPDSYTPYLGLGDVNKELKKNYDEALKYYLKSIALNPGHKKAQYCVGWCYNEKQQYNEALPYLSKAVSIDSKYNNAIVELGYCYYALKRYNEAITEFKKAIDNDNKLTLPYYYSGLCYVALNTKDDALKMYEKLQSVKPEFAEKLKAVIDKM